MPKRDIIVIGASAGGLEALCQLTKNLPQDLDATLFVVMHIGSESFLAGILGRCGALPATSAADRTPYQRGCIYVAPPNMHLAIRNGMTMLSRGPRENGHRPAIDVLFRSAAREHDANVIGIVLSGGRDDGSAGLYAIKKRGGIAMVQNPSEAIAPSMPRSALEAVKVDYCLPVAEMSHVLVELATDSRSDVAKLENIETTIIDKENAVAAASEPPGEQIPLACPECNGPMYETQEGDLVRYQCFVGHAFSPESLSEEHTEALERALWTAMRTLKERTVFHQKLIEKHKRNKGEEGLLQRLEESIATTNNDVKALREILDRI